LAASESSFSAAGTSKREEEESRVLSEPDPTSGMTEPTGGSDDEAKTLSVGEASPYVDHSLLPMSVFMDLSVNRFFFLFLPVVYSFVRFDLCADQLFLIVGWNGASGGGDGEKKGTAPKGRKVALPTVSNYTIHDADDTEPAKQDGNDVPTHPGHPNSYMTNYVCFFQLRCSIGSMCQNTRTSTSSRNRYLPSKPTDA
jgi:hypothetical protein